MIDANLTLNQLAQAKNGMNRLISMIGAKNFMKCDNENFVSFKFMRGAANKANYIKIKLNAADTYDIEFGKIHGMNYRVISEHSGLYFDMLRDLFEGETKLYLSI